MIINPDKHILPPFSGPNDGPNDKNKVYCAVIIIAIGIFGLWARVDNYKTKHPDNDELYELRLLVAARLNDDWLSIVDKKKTYGDHTSFPGEFLAYRPFLGLTSVKDWRAVEIDIEHMRVAGMERADFWKLAVPKILVCVVGLVVFGVVCYKMGLAGVAGYMVYVFNPHLVYHAFDMRPYSVLPVLAVLNYIACQNKWGLWRYGALVFFTCIYHAYGLLIALLPLLFYRRKDFWVFVPGFVLWAYYASFNSFGMEANAVQAVVLPFRYFKPSVGAYLTSFLGQGFLYIAVVPLIFLSLLSGHFDWKFLSVFILLPLLLIALVDIKTSYWIHPRQWVWVVPYFGIWVSMVLGIFLEQLYGGGNGR